MDQLRGPLPHVVCHHRHTAPRRTCAPELGSGYWTLHDAAGALIGIAVLFALGDVPAMVLALGTASSASTGAIGAAAVAAMTRRPATNS